MSNPVLTIGGYEQSGKGIVDLTSWAMNIFGREAFYPYSVDEYVAGIDPTKYTAPFNMIYTLSGMNGPVKAPDFIAEKVWNETYKKSPSAFVTANNSVMPKMVGPSVLLTSNGLNIADKKNSNLNAMLSGNYDWIPVQSFPTGAEQEPTGLISNLDFQRTSVSISDLALWVNVAAFKDNSWNAKYAFKLNKSKYESQNAISSQVNGAFSLVLKIIPVTMASAGADGKGGTSNENYNPMNGEDPTWVFKMSFGDVHAEITNVSAMAVQIDGGSGHTTVVNLAGAEASEGTPQNKAMGTNPMILTFFKCWNGIIVSAGRQDTSQVRHTASSVCTKYRDYSLKSLIDEHFDKDNPQHMVVPTEGDNRENYNVDFGTELYLYFKNCKAQFAYLPNFFVPSGAFDNWQLLNADSDTSTFEYELFTIFSGNQSGYSLMVEGPNRTKFKDKDTGQDYAYWRYNIFREGKYARNPAEVFGYFLKCVEHNESKFKNSNGTFEFKISNGNSQGEDGEWTHYITNVSVTHNLQASSGSIQVDGTGFGGYGASIAQSIGGISISANGGNFTVGGSIFKGIAMGIGIDSSSGGTTFNIPLVGVEKKLQDIPLINPPFLDGWTLGKACNYLFGYAGVSYEMDGDSGLELSASTEMTKAVFDWKSGTPVASALEDVMTDTHHRYYMIDGKAVVKELGDDGLPTSRGGDKSGKTYAEIINYDQTPDFEDLRNYCVAMGLTMGKGGSGTQLERLPVRPLILMEEQGTEPDIPWAKVWAQARPGYTNLDEDHTVGSDATSNLKTFVENMKKASKTYLLMGKVTIPGDASIHICDMWGENMIYSVSHNVDIQGKTWTTSLELMSTGNGSTSEGPGGNDGFG